MEAFFTQISSALSGAILNDVLTAITAILTIMIVIFGFTILIRTLLPTPSGNKERDDEE